MPDFDSIKKKIIKKIRVKNNNSRLKKFSKRGKKIYMNTLSRELQKQTFYLGNKRGGNTLKQDRTSKINFRKQFRHEIIYKVKIFQLSNVTYACRSRN